MDIKPTDLILSLTLVLTVLSPVYCVCENGWYEFGNTCYYISDARYKITDLQTICKAKNATLWTNHNETELKFVESIIVKGPRILYWTDLQIINRQWVWGDRSVTYDRTAAHWYKNQEGNRNSANKCAAMFSYKPYLGQLQQKRCTDGWGTICTRPNNMLDFCDIANDWRYIDGWCLKFFSTPKTWQDARTTCHAHQGDLTIYKSYLELTNLYNIVPCRTQENIAWIGLSDTVVPRSWKWINNDTVRYSRWYPYGNQILKNGSTCAATDPINSWQWKNYQCNDLHPFICNRSLGVCPNGWLPNQDRCYQPNVVPSSQKTWFDAKTYCESMGTELLIIDSDIEQSFINATMNTLQVTKAWLGFSDEVKSDVLAWVNGVSTTDASIYQHWDKNFPRPNAKRFDCGLVNRGNRDSRWANGYCYNFNSFFCEMIVTTRPFAPTPTPMMDHCDQNWRLYGHKCYYFGPSPGQSLKTWNDAMDYCRSSLGDLVILDDPYEISFVTVQQAKDTTSWIGLKYDPNAQKLVWPDGTSPGQNQLKETNFYPGEPDDITHGQLCIQIVGGRRDFSGSWDDGNCSVAKAFICEKLAYPGSSPMPTTPPAPYSWSVYCGPQWVYDSSENYCYQVVLNNPRTWTAARTDCIAKGGDLVSITGRTEQNFVQAMLSTGQYASIQVNFWIGATDQTQEGGWHWTDDAPFRYLNWYPGEPNNYIKGSVPEDCAEMVPAWNYQWNDKFCAKEQLYICKKNALVTSRPTISPPTGVAAMANCPGEPMMSGNYSLADSSVFAASTSRDAQHGPTACRWYKGSTGAWSAKTIDTNQYISAQFFNTIVVKGIVTAGRTDTDEWVSNYGIQYKDSYYADWLDYMDPPGSVKIFAGNTDSQTAKTNMLLFPFEAKIVRLKPTQWQSGISVRWEILGCVEESCSPDYGISGPLVVPNSALKASSVSSISNDQIAARLHSVTQGISVSCWIPKTSDLNQWIQADLGKAMIIRGVTIRGNPAYQQWVTQYRFQYSLSADSGFQYYQEPYLIPKTLPGNTDNTSPSTYMFKSHFQGRYVKIQPKAWNGLIAMAFDVLVCQNSCESIPLVTGSLPISDDQITASTVADNRHGSFRARLNQPSKAGYAGGWKPSLNDKHQYLQVDLGYMVQVAGVATQGTAGTQDWVLTYTLSYSNDGISYTQYFELGTKAKVFNGNWDSNTVRKQFMLIPFIARYVRLWPNTWKSNIGLRVEYYGCPGADSGTKIGCFADNSHQRDLSYEPYTDPRVGMWPPMCINHCFRKGYYYAGIQAQYKCYCGNSYGRYGPATDCTLSCVPKNNFFCGGPSSSMVYTTGLSPQFKVCPNNWKSYKDKCYILLLNQVTWMDARADCKMLGGDLASPNSQQEQDFAYSLMRFTNGTDVWIGFNDIQDENVYQWADGRQVQYTAWGLGQPSHTLHANQDCVLMSANNSGSWSDAPCDSTNRVMCQMDKRPSIEPSVTTPVKGCPEGWDAYRWGCYLYADAGRTWQQAKSACSTFGGFLVDVFDRYEQAYLSSVLGGRSGEYWIGVTDTKVPGTFQNTNKGTALMYTNWAQNKPDATSQCVTMGSGKSAGLWYNHNCTDMKGMLCKQIRVGHVVPSRSPAAVVTTGCDNGTIQTDKYCYQVNVRPGHLQNDWQEALADCTAKGAKLASFHSAADIDTVWRQGLVGTQSSFWIGLNDRATESGYRWADGSVADVFNWAPSQPDNYNGGEDCVEMSPSTSQWNDNLCLLGRNWICMVNRGSHFTVPPTVIAPTAGYNSKCGNWSFYGNACYFVSEGKGDQGKSWRQARSYCQQNGGELASINSAQEELFVSKTLVKNVTALWLWIGYSELDSNTGFRWSDGSPNHYDNWNIHEPNDYGGQEDCTVMMIKNGKWGDLQCGKNAGFICKKNLGAKPTPVSPTMPWPGNCPAGFTALYNRCYKVFAMATNWTTALSNCQAIGKGYSLASIRNDVENAYLTTLLATMRVSPWIGLKKDGQNQLMWINNDDLTYTNFAYGEPNGKSNEKCVQMMIYRNSAGHWKDNKCSTKQGYICQTNKNAQITTPEMIPNLCDTRQNQQQFINNCYFLAKTAQSWNASNNNCIAQGAFLTSINTPFEQAFIYLMVSKNNVGPIWVGLNDKQSPGIYNWADKWPVQYTNWGAGQPVQSTTGACVMFNTTGRWIVTNCNKPMASICKITTAIPHLTPPPANGYCDPGWKAYINKCYYMGINQPMTVLDATLFCQGKRASLVSIHNQTENHFLVTAIKSSSLAIKSNSFWTSLHKSLNSGFQWADRTPVQYTNWRPGEPSTRGWGGNDENCAEVFLADGKWNDEDCNSKRAFICEKPQATDNRATGPGIFNVPTPIPHPSPISLPIQISPSTPGRKYTGTGPHGWSVLTTPRNPGSLATGRSVLPTINVNPYTGKNTQSQPEQQTKVVALGMSAGGLAGAIIGTLVVILLIVLVAMYWRRRTTQGQTTNFGLMASNNGFENKTYTYSKETEEMSEQNENGKGVHLRSLSESST